MPRPLGRLGRRRRASHALENDRRCAEVLASEIDAHHVGNGYDAPERTLDLAFALKIGRRPEALAERGPEHERAAVSWHARLDEVEDEVLFRCATGQRLEALDGELTR
jgi:hypothetical protein